MSADDNVTEPEPLAGLVLDPREPELVPGGEGRRVVCGRKRAPDGTHLLDTSGGSG